MANSGPKACVVGFLHDDPYIMDFRTFEEAEAFKIGVEIGAGKYPESFTHLMALEYPQFEQLTGRLISFRDHVAERESEAREDRL